MRNTFGSVFTLTSFGESHGAAVGGVVDGMPAGIDIDLDFIQHELSRRRPGQSKVTTSRNEPDQVELLSGVFEVKSTGTSIRRITIISAISSALLMPTIPIMKSMAFVTIGVAAVPRRVSR